MFARYIKTVADWPASYLSCNIQTSSVLFFNPFVTFRWIVMSLLRQDTKHTLAASMYTLDPDDELNILFFFFFFTFLFLAEWHQCRSEKHSESDCPGHRKPVHHHAGQPGDQTTAER